MDFISGCGADSMHFAILAHSVPTSFHRCCYLLHIRSRSFLTLFFFSFSFAFCRKGSVPFGNHRIRGLLIRLSLVSSVYLQESFSSDSIVLQRPFSASRIATRTVVRPLSSRCPAVVPGSFVPLKCHRTFQSQKRSCFIARFSWMHSV